MNKLFFLKKALIVSAAAMMAMPISTAFAITQDKREGQTEVSYDVLADGVSTTNEWEWSIPSDITLATSNQLEDFGTVSIGPADNRRLVLEDNTHIRISASASSFEADDAFGVFYLKHGASKIPYRIEIEGRDSIYNRFENGQDVLLFEAGISNNTGIHTNMKFVTTEDNIKNATLLGKHNDTLTFRVEQRTN